jgi:hypothetical protein
LSCSDEACAASQARTAQAGDRGHTTDMRLGYVEGQVARMKATLKQVSADHHLDRKPRVQPGHRSAMPVLFRIRHHSISLPRPGSRRAKQTEIT